MTSPIIYQTNKLKRRSVSEITKELTICKYPGELQHTDCPIWKTNPNGCTQCSAFADRKLKKALLNNSICYSCKHELNCPAQGPNVKKCIKYEPINGNQNL
jgi:hypothetical protein